MVGNHLPYQVLAQVTLRCFKLTKNIEITKGFLFLFIHMVETTKLCILALGTSPGKLSSKELEV